MYNNMYEIVFIYYFFEDEYECDLFFFYNYYYYYYTPVGTVYTRIPQYRSE